MDIFENPSAFYPTKLDYDVTLPSYDAALYPFDGSNANPSIDLDSFAGNDLPSSFLARKHQLSSGLFHDETAYSDANSNYDQQYFPEAPAQEAKTPPLDTHDALLQFSAPIFHYTLLDYSYRAAPISLDAELNGMFFSSSTEMQASSVVGDEMATPQQSVTCYRRNLFSISGSITLPRSFRYISTENGEQIPVANCEVSLSAIESMEGAAVKLISVPFKSASMPAGTEDKTDKDPVPIPIDLVTGSEMDSGFVSFPIVWKRLQFRSSTANNGRRKELQQTYSCRVSLMAMLSTGQRVSLCDMNTEPIVVRGRSPRAFATKKEAPTSGSIISQSRPKFGAGRPSTMDGMGSMPHIKSELDYNFDFNDIGMISPDQWHSRNMSQHGAMTALPPETYRMNPHEFLAHSSPEVSRYAPAVNVPAPVNLSLMDDDVVRKPSPGPSRDVRKAPRLQNVAGRPPSFSLGNLQGNNDNDDADDPLYEYFPLSLDDWQEPVDAVYRPHVVHHLSLPPPAKDVSRTRSKRYFSVASPK